jgi:antitoxin component YwqK of YwqJK toxin-antitoxin module
MKYTNYSISRFLIKIFLLLIVFSLGSKSVYAQFSFAGQIPPPVKYKPSQVIDPEKGIAIYDRLNIAIGDSTRHNAKGYAASDWIEDYYESGQLLHKGFYIDGKLKVYKNYWEDGKLERNFHYLDFSKSEMQVYFNNGQIRSDIIYNEGAPMKTLEYYPDGKPDFQEEYDKKQEYLLYRRSYFDNGNPTSLLEIKDAKKKTYTDTEYFDSGKVKEEGKMILVPGTEDYKKDGTWKVYDETGKLTAEEEYASGSLSSTKKY